MKNKQNRYTSRYNFGGKRMYQQGGTKSLKYKSRYQAGGMYGSNEIPSGLGATATSIYQEADPRLQEQREEGFLRSSNRLREESIQLAQELEEDKLQDEATLRQNEALAAQKSQVMGSGVKKVGQFIGDRMYGKPQIDPATGEPKVDELGNVITTSKVSDFSSDLIKSGKDLYKGQGVTSAAPKGTMSIINPTTGEGLSLMPGADVPAGFVVEGVSGGSKLSTGLSKLGSGIKAFGAQHAGSAVGKAGTWMTKGVAGGGSLAQMANPAMIATLAGMGIKKLAGDDDPTTFNVGEASGSVLSGAGTGAGIGSMIMPEIGTAAGAVIGGAFSGIKGLADRNKARDEKRKFEQDRQDKIDKYNTELTKNYAMQKGAVRAGNLRQKTYSGYDLGRNIVAQMGGMRMGMPRYRRAS